MPWPVRKAGDENGQACTARGALRASTGTYTTDAFGAGLAVPVGRRLGKINISGNRAMSVSPGKLPG
ncbi:hypothetical protein EB241_15035 [Erwinia psidii]|uniref:Uncharacterized protein n=1 Tax=Erwinia psidii TaxID=69224 RepID=A0A3N6SFU1_9GAMM|nr:hypothetical protein EB241_15035 [Erwinia psidii]